MLKLKSVAKAGLMIGMGVLAMRAVWLTYSAGRGQCPQCGYLKDLYACRHCN